MWHGKRRDVAAIGSSIRGAVLASIALVGAPPVHAQTGDPLADLINAYRAAPVSCQGRPASPAPLLTAQAALARVHIGAGMLLQQALENAGYPSEQAQAIAISGPADAKSAMAAIEQKYCAALLDTQFTAVGTTRSGNDWLVVLARPLEPLELPDLPKTGKAILDAVNGARAVRRTCGDQSFAAAPPVSWSPALAEAALAHSADMARHRYFSHQGSDGSDAGERALRAGYHWQRVGENIAAGQHSAQEAVQGWLSSPGHCANLMNPLFRETGAAYAINSEGGTVHVYWTQVFGTAR